MNVTLKARELQQILQRLEVDKPIIIIRHNDMLKYFNNLGI